MPFQKKKKLFLVFSGAMLLIFSLNFFQPRVKNFFYSFSAPFQKSFWQDGQRASGFLKNLANLQNLEKENKDLKLEIQKLAIENLELKEAEKENLELKEAMVMSKEREFSFILAETCFKEYLKDAVLINKGRKEGISEGMPVITSQKVLVGKIKEVFENFSAVSLISDPKISFNAEIEGRIQGVVKGKGNFQAVFELIPVEAEPQKGENVLSSGFEGVFPEGFLVGKLGELKEDDAASFQKAEIDLYFNASDISRVFIIKNF
jgi:rod shape-determining protein MreC